jgi:ATP-dependent Clp protease ATP-binding subunit ClpA
MFERFTKRARLALVSASTEARTRDDDFIGTEHLLLGLLAIGEGVAHDVLAGAGVSHEAALQAIDDRLAEQAGGESGPEHDGGQERDGGRRRSRRRPGGRGRRSDDRAGRLSAAPCPDGDGETDDTSTSSGADVDADALATIGIDLDAVRGAVEREFGPGALDDAMLAGTGRGRIGRRRQRRPAFTPRAKKALELALREALAMGHHYIGTEHVLLGLLREREGVAGVVLRRLAPDDDLRHAVQERLRDAS